MKHKINLIIFLLILAVNSVAQQTELCKVFSSVTENSKDKFASISGDDIINPKGKKLKKSKLEIKDASSCYIETTSYSVSWYSEFGVFDDLDGAKNKMSSIKAEFISCVPQLAFIEHKNPFTGLPYFYLKANMGKSFYFYQATFGIYINDDKKYVPFIKIPEDANPINYNYMDNEPDTSAFSRDVRRMIEESKTKFSSIIGEKVSSGFITKYKSNFCISNAYECYISDNMAGKEYDAYIGLSGSDTDAIKNINAAAQYIAMALGKKYVWSINEKEKQIGFCQLDDADSSGHFDVIVKQEFTRKRQYVIVIAFKEPKKF